MRRAGRRVGDGVELAVAQIHAGEFLGVEGTRSATTEDGKLVAAFIHGTVAVSVSVWQSAQATARCAGWLKIAWVIHFLGCVTVW